MKINVLIGLCCGLLFFSCKKEENLIEHFFLKNNEAVMPVYVKGNVESDVLIVVLHGGPGDGALRSYMDPGFFDGLEGKYRLVYWDQRCAGLSQGNCDPDVLNFEQYREDLAKLVDLLFLKYGASSSVFLMGHSWGGTLGMLYLTALEDQSRIKGFINVDGPHNFPLTANAARDGIVNFGNDMVQKGIATDQWQGFIDRVANRTNQTLEDVSAINKTGYQTNDVLVEMDSVNAGNYSIAPGTFISGLAPSLVNQAATSASTDFFEDFIRFDLSDSLANITIPVAAYYGRFDFVIPPAVMLDFADHLINTSVEVHEFRRSHHSPMLSENALFQLKVEEFVEENR
jgi:pimeloyl-ACP methyl ester carboxylesterase